MKFEAVIDGDNYSFYPKDNIPAGITTDGNTWRLKVKNKPLDSTSLLMMGGGAIVGKIPEGLPTIAMPDLTLKSFLKLLPTAIIISLLGFMEAIAIAKAMAAKTGQKIDANQELIGQGLANICGSFGSSYSVSGSFSRSAVNLAAGAVTGSVFGYHLGYGCHHASFLYSSALPSPTGNPCCGNYDGCYRTSEY